VNDLPCPDGFHDRGKEPEIKKLWTCEGFGRAR